MPKKLTQENFVNRAINLHGDKYDYSSVNYINNYTKIEIVCYKHGVFYQTPKDHLRGHGCPHCGQESIRLFHLLDTDTFKEKAIKVHGNKYDYSLVYYKGTDINVDIICPLHGLFKQTPHSHLNGGKCYECSKINGAKLRNLHAKSAYVKKANKKHNSFYTYGEYISCYKPIDIYCPYHGKFSTPANEHLKGSGCPKCNRSHLENDIASFLNENNIHFIEQADKKELPWLGLQRLDFYLPDYNIAIECQGRQHFQSVAIFGGEDGFIKCVKQDILKAQRCQENGIKLLYYSNLDIAYPYHVFEDKSELLKAILNEDYVIPSL